MFYKLTNALKDIEEQTFILKMTDAQKQTVASLKKSGFEYYVWGNKQASHLNYINHLIGINASHIAIVPVDNCKLFYIKSNLSAKIEKALAFYEELKAKKLKLFAKTRKSLDERLHDVEKEQINNKLDKLTSEIRELNSKIREYKQSIGRFENEISTIETELKDKEQEGTLDPDKRIELEEAIKVYAIDNRTHARTLSNAIGLDKPCRYTLDNNMPIDRHASASPATAPQTMLNTRLTLKNTLAYKKHLEARSTRTHGGAILKVATAWLRTAAQPALELEDYTYDYDEETFNKIPKEYVGNFLGFETYLVDGLYVRNKIFIDFLAGHHVVDPYIPEGEIWLDRAIPKAEIKYYLMHELMEALLMANTELAYDDAHKLVSEIEMAGRYVEDSVEK